MLVGVGDALVVLFEILVDLGVRVWVAPAPEGLDELLALLVGLELVPSLPLLRRDDVGNVLLDPLLEHVGMFFLDVALAFGHVLLVGALVLLLRRRGGRAEKQNAEGQGERTHPLMTGHRFTTPVKSEQKFSC